MVSAGTLRCRTPDEFVGRAVAISMLRRDSGSEARGETVKSIFGRTRGEVGFEIRGRGPFAG